MFLNGSREFYSEHHSAVGPRQVTPSGLCWNGDGKEFSPYILQDNEYPNIPTGYRIVNNIKC